MHAKSTIKNAAGFTFIELIAVIAIISLLINYVGIPYLQERQRAAVMAGYKNQIKRIGEELQQNYLGVYGTTIAAGGTVSGVANPLAPTIAELNALHVLRGEVGTGTYGGQIVVALRLWPTGCVAPSCDVDGGVVGTKAITRAGDGTTLDRAALGQILQEGENDFGVALPGSPSVISGPAGNWTMPNPTNTAGVIGMHVGYGSSVWAQYCKQGGDCNYNNLTTTGTLTSNGALVANGAAALNNGMSVVGNMNITGNETVSGQSTANSYVGDGSRVVNVQNSVNAVNATNANYATNAGYATTSGYSTSSGYSNNSNYSNSAGTVGCGGVVGASYNVCTGN